MKTNLQQCVLSSNVITPFQRCKFDTLFFMQYSRYKEVRDALDVAITEMQKTALNLKKVYAEIAIAEIADTLDTTSDKLQEGLDGPTPSDVEDMMDDWDWRQQHF
jgi:hypothetical protein